MASVLIVTDLDGCLLDDGEVVKEYANLLQGFDSAEVLWTFATGRSRYSAQSALMGLLPTAPLRVADDGAHVFDDYGMTLRELTLDQGQLEETLEHGYPKALWINASVKNGAGYHFLLGHEVQRQVIAEAWGERYIASSTASKRVFLERLAKEQVLRLQVFTKDHECLIPEVSNTFRMRLRHSPLYRGWQYAHAEANKGSGVQFIQRELGFTADRTIVVGDADNDIPMFSLEVAHRRIVVGEQPPEELRERMTHQVLSSTSMETCLKIIEELL